MTPQDYEQEVQDGWNKMNDDIQKEGYAFDGNVVLPNDSDDDGVGCNCCGAGGFFVVLYKHTEKPHLMASTNLCYDCGCFWCERYEWIGNLPTEES